MSASGLRPAGRTIVAATLCLTLGCAGDEVTSPADGEDIPTGTELTRAEIVTAMQEIRDLRRSLPSDDRQVYNESLVAYLKQRPDIRGAGISWDRSVWAEFSDGRSAVFVNNRIAADGGAGASIATAAAAPAAAPTSGARSPARDSRSAPRADIPQGDNAHVISVLPSQSPGLIADWLASSGYQLQGGGVLPGSIEDFRGIRSADVVTINTHGAVVGSGSSGSGGTGGMYVLGTADFIGESEARAGNYGADRNWNEQGASLLVLVQFGDDTADHIVHWAITPAFVEQYWQLNPNSLVFVVGCTSFGDGTTFTRFRNTVIGKGASSYLGWAGVTGLVFADQTGAFFFDRVLGMNAFAPEDPPQRPFNYRKVLIWLGEENLDFYSYTDPRTGGTYQSWLRLTETGAESGILVPTIKRLQVDELNERLTIEGQFGSDPSDGQVTVDGTRMFVETWNENRIEVRIPASDPPFAGPVLVKVREHESNELPLTAWKGPFTYTVDMSQAWAPNLEQKVSCDLHLRSDVHPYREKPGEDPIFPEVPFVAAQSSECSFEMSGTGQDQSGHTLSLSGQGTMTWFSESLPFFSFNGTAHVEEKTLTAYLSVGAWGKLTITNGGSVTQDISLAVDLEPLWGAAACPPAVPPPGFPFPMDPGSPEGWSIQKEGRTGDGPCAVANMPTSLEWEAIPAQFPPTTEIAS